jgi:ATP-binding protein involved in chromosome partitioning
MPGVKHIIGVGAGKGGVGKSTVAVNLAVALAHKGCAVGLLDADVYGPSVPIMMGLADAKPSVDQERKILPLAAHGVVFMSMGLLVKREDAVVWRGPMIARAVTQFCQDVRWGELDYLIVDLPPGTGDVALSLAQTIPVSGTIVVATPQDVAFADVTRALRMFEMLRLDVLGLVENMSYFICPSCDVKHAVFGKGRTEQHCAERGIPLLASLPLDENVSPHADAGKPIVVAEPGSEQARIYTELAATVIVRQDEVTAAKEAPADKHAAFFNVRPGN